MSSINTELYPIGTADNFIQKVVGLFKYSNGFRDFSLSNNPLEMRYAGYPSTHTSVYSEFIGQGYAMNDNRKNFDHFWDYDNGIVGFTYDEGYLDTLNSSVIANMDTLRRNVFDFDNNAMYLYNTDVYRTPVYFPYINSLGDIDYNNDEDRLIRLFKYYTENRNLSLLNGYTSEKYKPNRIVYKKYEYYPATKLTNGEEKTYVETKSKALSYETDVDNDFFANSVDKPSFNDYDYALVKSNSSRDKTKGINYKVYEERNENDGNIYLINNNVHKPSNVTLRNVTLDKPKSNSIVGKTNELFKQGKINSLINRFHTKSQEPGELESAVDDVYGLSRGRNLVRGDSGNTNYNGYDDPYCRVWTISNQYSKYSDRIRPFYNNGVRMTVDEFDKKSFMEGLRPFSKEKSLRLRSSMQDNGLPLIAPMNHDGDLDKNDIKRCMFSIENLAWRDVNFNVEVKDRKTGVKRGFGKVLSDEQQGPNGGRIMWFPPYNLKFTENVGVNWNSNSFIGRGEQVYTYVNTDRGGTLDFTLLIDHPSILDLYSDGVGKIATNDKDQDILRFFAGCGMLEPVEKKRTIEVETEEKEYEKSTPSVDPVPDPLDITINKMMFAFFPNDFSGVDYVDFASQIPIEYLKSGGYDSRSGYEIDDSMGIIGCISVHEKIAKNKNGLLNTWLYEVDDRVSDEVLGSSDNYKDLQSFGLNNANLLKIIKENGGTPSGTASVLTKEDKQTARNILRLGDMTDNEIDETVIPFVDINTLKTAFTASTATGVIDLLQKGKVKVRCVGFASSHGYNNSNLILAKNRAKLLQEYLINSLKFQREWFEEPETIDANVPVNGKGISSFVAKLGRHAAVYIEASYKDVVPTLNRNNSSNMTATEEATNKTELKGSTITDTRVYKQTREVEYKSEYDDEYRYFREVQDSNDLVRKYITNKVQYFDPAFHSITPEGFNARLTFLHQCTRQGPTVAASDSNNASSAGNLAFGRPPVCVLRIGDFYNTRIIIDSISINYDNNGVQWDMNPEGIGLQPMFANVSISFKFIGGSDLSGPISRLQNAVSYNFFANTSVYDRHADYRNAFIDDKDGGNKVNEWQAGINVESFKEDNNGSNN